MIPKDDIRRLVLQLLETTKELQYNGLRRGVESLVKENGIGDFEQKDERNLNEIVWDLIIERVLTLGTESHSDPQWPFLRLTDYGKLYIYKTKPHYYQHDEYIVILKEHVPELDEIVIQYTIEAIRCFRRELLFAAAVMIGAAGERVVILLLEAIESWEQDGNKKKKIKTLLQQPRLPKIFDLVRKTVESLINQKQIPYDIHKGVTTHLLSIFEMIRVQRNNAVHPTVSKVSREKIFLTLQSFPAAIEAIYRVRDWFLRHGSVNNE